MSLVRDGLAIPQVEQRELRYFVAVAEELHFTRAAARLAVSQPPLSATIARLEAKLGAQLFVRDSRNVALTAAGAELLARARRILDDVDEAVGAVRQAAVAGPDQPCAFGARRQRNRAPRAAVAHGVP
jgi:DNA-binding transcriptional LysR family regulator